MEKSAVVLKQFSSLGTRKRSFKNYKYCNNKLSSSQGIIDTVFCKLDKWFLIWLFIQASEEWLSTHFQPRVSATFVDLQNPEFQPLCGEVDLTGYVINITDGQGWWLFFFLTVSPFTTLLTKWLFVLFNTGSSPAFYLVDGKLNFVKVRCFSSLAQSGVEDVVKLRELLALSNLQLRGQSTSPTAVVYAGDLTVFSTNPKETHLQESLTQLRNQVQVRCIIINYL